jgi:hypothetical protein
MLKTYLTRDIKKIAADNSLGRGVGKVLKLVLMMSFKL